MVHGKTIGAAVAVAAATFALTGCAGPSASPQDVTVEYVVDGTESTATVELPGVLCVEAAGKRMFSTTERGSAGQSPFTASVDADGSDGHLVAIRFGDDLWFLSRDAFTADEHGVNFDGLVGTIGEGTPDELPTATFDDAAVLTGELRCTDTSELPTSDG
ncbi:hypothetical protein [Agromyces sp. Marseille-Q5079]|uniref:hypothetical protein n=1 Tax=Agromyces sp. Marseille-Q5079 TaxID=3439059 RepID=UPI003D9C9F52